VYQVIATMFPQKPSFASSPRHWRTKTAFQPYADNGVDLLKVNPSTLNSSGHPSS
jgi:hypothetical protein